MTVQLICAAVLTILSTLIHGAGVVAIAHWLGLDRPPRKTGRLHPRTALILSAVALMLFSLHLLEIALFAGFYLLVGALPDLEFALFFSASAYSTLASPEADFPQAWRLVGGARGACGLPHDRLVDGLLRHRHEQASSRLKYRPETGRCRFANRPPN